MVAFQAAVANFLSHEEGVVVLIKQPRLQVAARKNVMPRAHGGWGLGIFNTYLSPSKNSRFHEFMLELSSLKLARSTSSALPISLSRI